MPTSPEITAAAKALQGYAGDDFKEAARLALAAAEEKRQTQAKWVAAGSIRLPLPGMEPGYTEQLNFVVGPFSTKLQAQKAGEQFAWDPKSKRGEGKYWVVPILANGQAAWDSIRPVTVKESAWSSASPPPAVFEEKEDW
jgi:hypothetical protein